MQLEILVSELDGTVSKYKRLIDGNSHEQRYKKAVEVALQVVREGYLAAPGSGEFKHYPPSRVLMVTYGKEMR